MVPSSFSVVTEIQKPPQAKRPAGLSPAGDGGSFAKGQDKPEKLTVEQQVVKIWQEVLDRKQLDLYASFLTREAPLWRR